MKDEKFILNNKVSNDVRPENASDGMFINRFWFKYKAPRIFVLWKSFSGKSVIRLSSI